MEMAGLTVPIICIVIGEGGSGGALGLGIGDKIFMLENSTYSVISPEGASSILWKDAGLAQEAAESMKITSYDLKKLNVIDGVIPEVRGGAHRDVGKQAEEIRQVLTDSLNELHTLNHDQLLENRFEKYKNIGDYSYLDL